MARHIELPGNKIAIVDDSMYELLFPYSWHNGNRGYAKTAYVAEGRSVGVSMHRFVWELTHGGIPSGYEIDHINGDRLDNRTENLRLVTARQNHQNKRCHRDGHLLGVTRSSSSLRPWQASIRQGGRRVYLGCYPTPEQAHEAYMKAVKEG